MIENRKVLQDFKPDLADFKDCGEPVLICVKHGRSKYFFVLQFFVFDSSSTVTDRLNL